jgi:hypothetical protein
VSEQPGDGADLLPSTAWSERVPPDEEKRFARYAEEIGAIQIRKSRRYGTGRALHRKQRVGLRGVLSIPADLPEHAAHGLFARPGDHEVLIRLSNGGVARAKDSTPDIRGFAIKVLDVRGPGALGFETSSQDFLLINQPVFGIGSADEFVGLVDASAMGRRQLFGYMIGRYGLSGGVAKLKATAAGLARPFTGFATEPFFSAAPIACGPYAVRVRLVPVDPAPPAPDAKKDWAADIATRLKAGRLQFDLQLQFFADEAVTPIEDATVDWPTPYLTVGRLTVPQTDLSLPPGPATQEAAESAAFDPWSALVEHRPLGEIMRARKAAYRTSQRGRGLS